MDNTYQVICSKNLDHLGIIAGIIDYLGIVEKIFLNCQHFMKGSVRKQKLLKNCNTVYF